MILFLLTTTTVFAPSAAGDAASPFSNSTLPPHPVNFHFLPTLPHQSYQKLGDVNIGVILVTLDTVQSKPVRTCTSHPRQLPLTIESTEAIAFAIDYVNRSPDILPNVTLGFVVEGICNVASVALGTSLSFLSRSKRVCDVTGCSTRATTSWNPAWYGHDVIGLVTTGYSRLVVPVSSLYGVGQVPIIGPLETSDELSNKVYHPYFFRIVPPDTYQVRAILKFISANGWSYVSVLYNSGDYGRNAFDVMRFNADRYGICIATSHELMINGDMDYDGVIDDLLLHSRARVVVIFAWPSVFRSVLQSAINRNATGHFIWIGSDAMVHYNGYKYDGLDFDPAVGAFTFDLYSTYLSGFYDYLRQQRVMTSQNPWMKPLWEWMFDCSFKENTCDLDSNVLQSSKYKTYKGSSLRIDSVMTFARAAHDLLREECPDARGEEARACITGELLRDYLKKLSADNFNGRVEFDENQDVRGRYIIRQLIYDYYRPPFQTNTDTSTEVKKSIFGKTIGIYDSSTDVISFSDESVLSWSHLNAVERIIPMKNDSSTATATTSPSAAAELPESVCSGPCRVGEYKIEREVPCCWECRRCRDNERLVQDNTSCEACPSFTWPDPSTAYTVCIDIPPAFPRVKDTIPIVFNTLAVIALLLTLAISAAYARYHNERVIKASSRELSAIQLVAIFVGYATVVLFQTTPTHVTCGVVFFCFCTSFVLLYAPLLVKTVRIYRIFNGGKKNERPKFIGTNSQVAITMSLIAVQASLCIATYILYQPRAIRTQPVWSEKFVELSCDLTFPGIASFLGYNIVLVFLCSVFAFTVRKLPDNFNESKFISMCVFTTLLIWLAFIPTYFTADKEYIRTFLLSVALLLNHSVALFLLMAPKIYAVKFVAPEKGDFSTMRS